MNFMFMEPAELLFPTVISFVEEKKDNSSYLHLIIQNLTQKPAEARCQTSQKDLIWKADERSNKEGKQFEIRDTNRWICREQSLLRCCSVFPSPLSDLESKDD